MAETKQKSKKTRRGRGEGSIRWIERIQMYECRYSVGVDENGKPIIKNIYSKKKSEALERMRDDLASVGKGMYVNPSEKSLYAYCKEWYETYKKPSLKRSNTKLKYEGSLKRLENADIANVMLKDLSLELIQKYYNELKEQGKSEATIRITHALINGALEHAEDTKKILKNYARKAIIPKDDTDNEGNVKALTESELAAFLDDMSKRSHYYMFALFMANTGLRPGEAIALNRSDLNLKENKVKVTKTYNKEAKGKIQDATKTKSSRRTVPVPSNIIKLMKVYMLKQKKQSSSDPLFQTTSGTRLTPRNVLRQFKAAGERIGCEWINLHTMRHTFASRLFKKKVDIKVISKLLGHKDVATTYDIYIHFIDDTIDKSVQVLNTDIPKELPEKRGKKKKDNIAKLKEAK